MWATIDPRDKTIYDVFDNQSDAEYHAERLRKNGNGVVVRYIEK